jgi:hypothetical protein
MSGKSTKTIAQRMASLTDAANKHGCTLWRGATDGRGYGQVHVNGRTVRAARVALQAKLGFELSSDVDACHDCDRFYPAGDITYRRCVNPDHLFPGTRSVNMRDCCAKNRHARAGVSGDDNPSRKHPERLARGDRHGSRTKPFALPRGDSHYMRRHPERILRGDDSPNTKFTSSDKARICADLLAGVTLSECSKRYGISQSHASRLRREARGAL